MNENSIRNGHSAYHPNNATFGLDDDKPSLTPDELSDLVAEAVINKLEEDRHKGAFINTVIARVQCWQDDLGLSKSTTPAILPQTHSVPQFDKERQQMPVGIRSDLNQLYYKYENDDFSELKTRLLVSCFDNSSREGGLYELDFGGNTYRRVFYANSRGITKYNGGYILVCRDEGLVVLDAEFQIKSRFLIPALDLHGVAVGPGGLIFIVETKHNRVGIYRGDSFERVDEIVVSPDREDRNHANDICFRDGKLLLSMFSTEESYRTNFENGIFDGAIIEYDLLAKKPVRRIEERLKMPHSLKVFGDDLCFCESFDLSVVRADDKVAKFSGYTRGLDFDGRFLFVGQSRLRHKNKHEELTLSNDAGIHVVDTKEHITRFIQIPCSDIYSVMAIQ